MRIAFFSAAMMAAGLAAAAAPIDGWYANLFGGYTYVPDNVTTIYQGLLRNRASYNDGYNAGGRLGYKSNPLRYEAEVTYLHTGVSGFFVNRIKQGLVTGQFRSILGMANVYYDFPEMIPCIAPFLGLGLGYGWVQSELNSLRPLGRTYFKRSDNLFAYQGTAGVIYNFAENYSLDIAYRYLSTTRADNLGKVVQANLASVGVTYRFDESSYK